MKRTLLTLALGLAALAPAAAQGVTTQRFECVADTWIRENNVNYTDAWDKATIETKREKNETKDGDGNVISTTYTHMAGLMAFDFAVPDGMKVSKAVMHIVTERRKGTNVSLRAYASDFQEKTSWKNELDPVTEALAKDPVQTFTPNGQNTKAIFDGLNESYRNLDAWKNEIDLTGYVKSLPRTTTRINLLFTQDGEAFHDNANFYGKDNTGLDSEQNKDNGYAGYEALRGITKEQLLPYLEVEFVEDASITTYTTTSAADTWVRKGNTANRGTAEDLEIYFTLKDGARDAEFYGLMSFILPEELKSDEYKLESAQLRLTSTFHKGSKKAAFYDYANVDFAESTTFGKEEDTEHYITSALANEPFVTIDTKGRRDWSIGDWLDQATSVEDWTCHIDLTDYIAAHLDKSKVAFLISQPSANSQAIKFATKEKKDFINKRGSDNKDSEDESLWHYFYAKDMIPQLTIVYSKVEAEQPAEPEGDELTEHIASNWVAGKNWEGKSDAEINLNTAGQLEVTLNGDDKTEMYGTVHYNEPVRLTSADTYSIIRLKGYVSKIKTNVGIKIGETYCELNDNLYELVFDGKNGETYAYCKDIEAYAKVYKEKLGVDLEFPHILLGSKGSDKLVYENGWYGFRIYQNIDAAPVNTLSRADNPVVTVIGHKIVPASDIMTNGNVTNRQLVEAFGVNYNDVDTSVSELGAADNAPAYYNLQGVRVLNPTEGLYIRVQNGKAVKVLLKN